MILVLRGEPSLAGEEWHELHPPGPLALPGSQAHQAHQAPQAPVPAPVQGVPAPQAPAMKLGVG